MIRDHLAADLVGVYLVGSAAYGGLHHESDLDFIAVVRAPLDDVIRHALVGTLLETSGRWPLREGRRPVEVTILDLSCLLPWRYPPRADLVYGEWMREDLEAGRLPGRVDDPDLAILLASAQKNRILYGPDLTSLLDPVPMEDVRRAILASAPTLVRELRHDTRNVLLTLARMWATLETGEIMPKEVAGAWALSRLPEEHRPALSLARSGYLGESNDDWARHRIEAASLASYMARAIVLHD